MNQRIRWLGVAIACIGSLAASAQTGALGPSGYSIATPRPISPADGTTNPGAQAIQRQNPYLGSVPSERTNTTIHLSLRDAVDRGLRYNLGVVESNQASAAARAARLRSLSALLPQISAQSRQALEDISYSTIGLKFPAIPGLPALPPTTGAFGFQDARISVTQPLYDLRLRQEYRAEKYMEQTSLLNIKDARDVVVFAAGIAYVQVLASAARVETAKAQLATARELDQLTADRVKSEVSPEIDSLRSQVEQQSAAQRLTNAANQFEKDKLALARVVGFPADQEFVLSDPLAWRPLTGMTLESATQEALHSRADLASAVAYVRAAESTVRAQKAQRLPVVSFRADYGGAGVNVGSFNRVYTVSGNVSVPLYTGGRIQSDVLQAQADLARRKAEYADLKGRVAYDIRVAWLDLNASDSSVRVAERNKALAARALIQSRDRYLNGVTNYLEVIQAHEAVAAAGENYIQSLYSFNVALLSLARAMGGADTRLYELSGGK